MKTLAVIFALSLFSSAAFSQVKSATGVGGGSGAASASYAAGRAILPSDTTKTGMPNRLSMNVTVARQTPNTSFGARSEVKKENPLYNPTGTSGDNPLHKAQ